MLLAGLIFAPRIFRGAALAPDAATWSYGFTTLFIIVGPAVADSAGGDAVTAKFIDRIALFMVAPLFNVMARIDPSLFEAARDQGAKGWQILLYIIIPMTKPGIAIGTIFVVALVAGDFTAVRVVGGGQMGTVATTISTQYGHTQYTFATASGIIFLVALLMFVGGLMRVVNVREQL